MESVLLALLIFQIKHFLSDFVLQTSNQVLNKGRYLHMGGITHAGLHMLGSVPALLVLTRVPFVVMALLLGEFLIHYHTDWSKAQIDRALRLNDTNTLYWTIFGSDQLIHQLTYLGMCYAALRFG
ncbi:MAG TPA: DUF3307 domain-containing protein [Rhizomicrobium sp.]|nr:DUF3307 domain-containing protein [Rhizomicrobium sp.]